MIVFRIPVCVCVCVCVCVSVFVCMCVFYCSRTLGHQVIFPSPDTDRSTSTYFTRACCISQTAHYNRQTFSCPCYDSLETMQGRIEALWTLLFHKGKFPVIQLFFIYNAVFSSLLQFSQGLISRKRILNPPLPFLKVPWLAVCENEDLLFVQISRGKVGLLAEKNIFFTSG